MLARVTAQEGDNMAPWRNPTRLNDSDITLELFEKNKKTIQFFVSQWNESNRLVEAEHLRIQARYEAGLPDDDYNSESEEDFREFKAQEAAWFRSMELQLEAYEWKLERLGARLEIVTASDLDSIRTTCRRCRRPHAPKVVPTEAKDAI